MAVRLITVICTSRGGEGDEAAAAATRNRLIRQLLRHGLTAAGGGRAAMLLATVDRDFNENDYQQLLALDENTPTQMLARADASEVRALPEVVLPPTWTPAPSLAEDQRSCSICLSQYHGGERQRILPCFHRFHSECVDRWLTQGKAECPICKTSVRQGGGHVQGAAGGTADADGDVSPRTLQAIEAAEAGRSPEGGPLPGVQPEEVAGLVAALEEGGGSDEEGGGSDSDGHLGLGGL